MATHGYMSERRPSMSFYSTQSHTLACTQLIYCIALIIQLFLSVCIEDICIPSVLHRHFCCWISGNSKPTPSDSHWQPIVCTHWLSKASVISSSSESHSVLNAVINTTGSICSVRPLQHSEHVWFMVYSWEDDGKEKDMQKIIFEWISVNEGTRKQYPK